MEGELKQRTYKNDFALTLAQESADIQQRRLRTSDQVRKQRILD